MWGRGRPFTTSRLLGYYDTDHLPNIMSGARVAGPTAKSVLTLRVECDVLCYLLTLCISLADSLGLACGLM